MRRGHRGSGAALSLVSRRMQYGSSVAQAEGLWYDVSRWRSWVDGFGDLVECRGAWPDVGGSVTWDSTPYGRGRVVERVREFHAGRGQAVSVQDERLEGVQRVSFVAVGQVTEVTFELDYKLRNARPGSAIVDLLFIRRAVGDSLGRTLEAFGHELEQRAGGPPAGQRPSLR
jgi:hypothetical protein